MAHALHPDHLPTRQAAWYPKAEPTFVDALAADIYGSNEIRQLGLLSWVPSIHRRLSLTCSLRLLATLLKLAKVESLTRLWPILPRLTSHHSQSQVSEGNELANSRFCTGSVNSPCSQRHVNYPRAAQLEKWPHEQATLNFARL